jgi:hypothetical protein
MINRCMAAMASAILGVASLGWAQQSEQVPVWSASGETASTLASPVAIDRYTIRPPKQYGAVPPKADRPDLKFFVWAPPKHTALRSTSSTLVVEILTIAEGAGAGSAAPYNANAYQAYRKAMEDALKLRNWKQTPVQKGMINTIPFTRVHWKADSAALRTEVYGFYYVAVDGNRIVTINTVDASPLEVDLREAAALSLCRK